MLTNHSLFPVPEPEPPRLWKQGMAALLGLVLVVMGACFEHWYSPAAAFLAMGAGYFVVNFLIALPKSLPLSERLALVTAMHFVLFCLMLALGINGLIPLIFFTFACSLLGMAMGSSMRRVNKGSTGPRAMG
jgi:hypothetical protein